MQHEAAATHDRLHQCRLAAVSIYSLIMANISAYDFRPGTAVELAKSLKTAIDALEEAIAAKEAIDVITISDDGDDDQAYMADIEEDGDSGADTDDEKKKKKEERTKD